MILASGAATNALIGFAAVDGGEARDRPGAARSRPVRAPSSSSSSPARPTARPTASTGRSSSSPAARQDRASGHLRLRPLRLPAAPGPARLHDALAAGWDVVPVVVQDPVWERSFPDVSGRHAAARRSRRPHVLARPPEPQGGRARRELNEQRAAGLDRMLRELRARPRGTITSSDRRAVHAAVSRLGRRAATRGREAGGERGRPAEMGGRSRSCAGRPRCSQSGSIVGASIAAVLAVFLVDRPSLHRAPARPTRSPSSARSRAPRHCSAIPSRPRSTSTRATRASRPGRSASATSFGPYRVAETRSTAASTRAASRFCAPGSRSECLTRTCLPPQGGARVVRFRPFAVTYRRGGRTHAVLVSRGMPLQVSSRLPRGGAAGVGDRRYRAAARSAVRRARPRRFGRCCSSSRPCSWRSSGAALVVTALWPSSLRGPAARGRSCPRSSARSCSSRPPRADDDEAERRRTLDRARDSGSARRRGAAARAADTGARLGRRPHPSPRR